jgi:putative transposase
VGIAWSTLRYSSGRPLQEALRLRLRELAATHVRYGYRRLTVLLRREGWQVNAKRVYRLYDDENLKVRSVERKKIGRRQRVPQGQASGPNQCWSADFVSDKLTDGRSYRVLTVVDQFTRDNEERSQRASLSITEASSPGAFLKHGPSSTACNSASSAQDVRSKMASSKASTAGCEMNA